MSLGGEGVGAGVFAVVFGGLRVLENFQSQYLAKSRDYHRPNLRHL